MWEIQPARRCRAFPSTSTPRWRRNQTCASFRLAARNSQTTCQSSTPASKSLTTCAAMACFRKSRGSLAYINTFVSTAFMELLAGEPRGIGRNRILPSSPPRLRGGFSRAPRDRPRLAASSSSPERSPVLPYFPEYHKRFSERTRRSERRHSEWCPFRFLRYYVFVTIQYYPSLAVSTLATPYSHSIVAGGLRADVVHHAVHALALR